MHLEVNIPIRLDRGADCMLFMSLWSECPPKGNSEVTEALCKVIRFWRHCSQKGLMLVFQSLLRPSSEDKSGVAHVCN